MTSLLLASELILRWLFCTRNNNLLSQHFMRFCGVLWWCVSDWFVALIVSLMEPQPERKARQYFLVLHTLLCLPSFLWIFNNFLHIYSNFVSHLSSVLLFSLSSTFHHFPSLSHTSSFSSLFKLKPLSILFLTVCDKHGNHTHIHNPSIW